jgi:hypothetical protein
VRADLNAGRALERDAGAMPSRVELTWLGGRIEHWILSGYETGETILDRCRRVLSIARNSVFAFICWAPITSA